MKFLFFDTEKSNSHITDKICEFGYVLTDDKFDILRTDDIPMSPGSDPSCRFEKSYKARGRKFQFGYDIETYYESPEFPKYYQKIKKLLEDEDTIVFAFAAYNDLRALNETCDRYKLPRIRFVAYDVQTIYDRKFKPSSSNNGQQTSLEKAYESLRYPHEMERFNAHLSRDDAGMTMVVLERMAMSLNISIDKIISTLCPECKCISYSDKYDNGVEYINVLHKDKGAKNPNISKEAHALWGELCKEYRARLESGQYNGHRYTIWSSVKTNIDMLKRVINKFHDDKTIVASRNLYTSDYIICMSEEDYSDVTKIYSNRGNEQLITIKEFLK